MNKFLWCALGVVSLSAQAASIDKVRTSVSDERSRIVFDLSDAVETSHSKSPNQLVISLNPVSVSSVSTPLVRGLRQFSAQFENQGLDLTLGFQPGASAKYFRLNDPERLVIDVYATSETVVTPNITPAKPVVSAKAKAPEPKVANLVVTRDMARQALAKQIDQISNAVVSGQLEPGQGRARLIAIRDALSAAVAGRDYDQALVADVLGLAMPKPASAVDVAAQLPEPPTPAPLPETPEVEVAPVIAPEPLPAPAAATPIEDLAARVEATAPAVTVEPAAETESALTEQAAAETKTQFIEIGTIRRPVLLNDMEIDFEDPFNPLELMFEAERQLLWSDLKAMPQ